MHAVPCLAEHQVAKPSMRRNATDIGGPPFRCGVERVESDAATFAAIRDLARVHANSSFTERTISARTGESSPRVTGGFPAASHNLTPCLHKPWKHSSTSCR